MFHSLYHRNRPVAEDAQRAWPATYLGGLSAELPEPWVVEVSGLVKREARFQARNLMAMPQVSQNRRIVDVSGWSYRGDWKGVPLEEVLKRVEPLPEAKYLHQFNLAGQQACLPLQEAIAGRVLLCHSEGGVPLTPLYGGPFRMMVFDRYSYLGLMQITRLVFADHPIPSSWENFPEALQPGEAYAVDLGLMQPVEGRGEITAY